MQVKSKGIVDGYFLDKYGKHGNDFNEFNMPIYSIPFEVIDYPKNVVCFAITLIDYDSTPICGFSWIHWLAVNIKSSDMLENQSYKGLFIEGSNSWFGSHKDIKLVSRYGGMAPPDKDHEYELVVYALDQELDIENGFFINELYKKMANHIICECQIIGKYKFKR